VCRLLNVSLWVYLTRGPDTAEVAVLLAPAVGQGLRCSYVPNLECLEIVPERILVDAREWRSSDSTRKLEISSDAELLHGTAIQSHRMVCPCLQQIRITSRSPAQCG
jgi:hypothetical protein